MTALVLDDDRLARLDLIGMLKALPGIGPIHEAATVAAALKSLPETGVLFVDVHLGEKCGFDFLAQLPSRENYAVVFTTGSAGHAARAFDVEATDYLLKPVCSIRLAKAWSRALEALRSRTTEGTGMDEQPGQANSSSAQLTERESEVLHWLSQGKSNAEIAVILAISPGTVKRHLENIYAKLGVENRHAAILHALRGNGR